MLTLAQDMFKVLQDRFRTTMTVMADLAESVGVPPTVTSLIHGLERMAGPADSEPMYAPPPPPAPAPVMAPMSTPATAPVVAEPAPPAEPKKRPTGKKRGLVGAKDLSDRVRPLEVDDAINGSTYLARIIWSLGVASLEGTGPLRPADMARMIMARSPVSLEPPNVARYIRRSKPSCIAVDHVEGNSNFYKLSDEGVALFEDKFGL